MKRLRVLVTVFLLVGVFGCSHVKEYIEIAGDNTISGEYLDVLNKNTREKTVYSGFETNIRIVATWKNSEFMDAYLSEYSRLYFSIPEDKEQRKDLLSHAAPDCVEFVFYAYIPDKDSNDFSKSDSIWRVYYSGEEGKRLEPIDIREIDSTPLVTQLFPYVKPYGKFYNVTFSNPIPSGHNNAMPPEEPALVFAGVLGKLSLEWADTKNR